MNKYFFFEQKRLCAIQFVKAVVEKLECKNCSIFLTFHKHLKKAMCHHCGYKTEINRKCGKTKLNCEFQMYGPGVEKISMRIKQIFSEKNIKNFI